MQAEFWPCPMDGWEPGAHGDCQAFAPTLPGSERWCSGSSLPTLVPIMPVREVICCHGIMNSRPEPLPRAPWAVVLVSGGTLVLGPAAGSGFVQVHVQVSRLVGGCP